MPYRWEYNPHKYPSQENIFATAEKIDIDHQNSAMRLRYQDGREIYLDNIEVYWPDLVRELYRQGYFTRHQAKTELKRCGRTLKRQPGEEDRP